MFSILNLGLVALLASHSDAFWRMSCPGRLVQERADPLIFPGQIGAHVHHIAGGNGFGLTTSYDNLRESSCSSCPITQDLSAYWTPKLYFQAQNGSFLSVPVAGDGQGVGGGMTVYYLQRPGNLPNGNLEKLVAFPEGFRMFAGDPFARSYAGTQAANAISFVCLDYSGKTNYPQGNKLPTVNCPDGVRAQVFFPSCWNGVDLDTPDHTSHMAYPNSSFPDSGPCPSTHPIHTISVFFEIIYQTEVFANDWHGNGQPFVFAQGDNTGYGFHGDFINGWDVEVLQAATNDCTDASGDMTLCPHFNFFTTEQSLSCQIPNIVKEDVLGPLKALPGCNPVQSGPQKAVNYFPTCADVGSLTTPQYYTDVTKSLGWSYVGCGNDSVTARTLNGLYGSNSTETVEMCIAYCSSHNFNFAGLEYGNQCYCGNSLPANRAPIPGTIGTCSMPCAGNNGEICGGAGGLSIYTKCTGNTCANIGYTPIVSGVASALSAILAPTPVSSSKTSISSSAASITSTVSTTLITSAAASSAPGSSVTSVMTSMSSSTSSAAAASTSTISCPASNGSAYTASNGDVFTIECYQDRGGGDLSMIMASGMTQCVQYCAMTTGCVGVSYITAYPNSFCYMKSKSTPQVASQMVWSASLKTNSNTKNSLQGRSHPRQHRRGAHGQLHGLSE